ncbi:hypothetical protein LTR56_021008 [Elasticomyces elasticus]|nr:hypothetical protein LTR56_021008 [Elasticomyces elasticus]KAK3628852.1 hypothetical protein LTR22_022181 [Elasticomyces elasticus]
MSRYPPGMTFTDLLKAENDDKMNGRARGFTQWQALDHEGARKKGEIIQEMRRRRENDAKKQAQDEIMQLRAALDTLKGLHQRVQTEPLKKGLAAKIAAAGKSLHTAVEGLQARAKEGNLAGQ